MNLFEQEKEQYNSIPIPEELSERINKTIERSSMERRKYMKQRKQMRRNRIKIAVVAAASVVIVFTAALNTSVVFAKTLSDVPVIGKIAQLLTIRSYEEETEDLKISVEIPTIEMISEDTNGVAADINEEIYTLCEQYAQEALQRAEEYKKAFLETGGTQEEWEEHNIEIRVGYELKSQTQEYISFLVFGYENWSNAYNAKKYYTLNLQTGERMVLADILGDDYIRIANESILRQMKIKSKQGIPFFTEDEGGFTTITDETKFYLNESGNPVIVFNQYEIAPGAYGEPEFEITDDIEETDISKETYYADNFSVEEKAVQDFAEKIKDAVEEKDLDALAELCSYPVYIGIDDGKIINSAEELKELGTETIFTAELIKQVEAADINNLMPSMAGFCISNGTRTGITFGVTDGKLGIHGINY